jgi:hypothetical protein
VEKEDCYGEAFERSHALHDYEMDVASYALAGQDKWEAFNVFIFSRVRPSHLVITLR